MRADEVARQPVSEPLAARLLALVEQWREQATSKQRDGYTMPARSRARLALFSAADMKQACADELAAALRRLPPQLLEEKEDVSRVHGVPGSGHGDLPRKSQRGDSK